MVLKMVQLMAEMDLQSSSGELFLSPQWNLDFTHSDAELSLKNDRNKRFKVYTVQNVWLKGLINKV